MQDPLHDPDPVRQHVLEALAAWAQVLGLTGDGRYDRAEVGAALAHAAQAIAAAQAANDAAQQAGRRGEA
jgi:hypothetical protein